ncbi:MAG: hypothetical protein PHY94_06200 [Candidatus Omnitrophica bacterium]|nr:hypothetical protein [Candidatus Omnitrophota bacterium]
MKIRLFGLLHFKAGEHSAENLSVKNSQEQIYIYVNNAINLSNSLQLQGIEFTLLTNIKSAVEKIVRLEGKTLQVIEIPFFTKVPHGIKFYSAYFKLDVFRYLASLSDEYVGLCDLDMVCINGLPLCFANNIESRIPMFYDISDQVIPAHGHEVIIQDLESIHHLKSEGRWSGGEFISGTPDFFATLTAEIDKIYDNYLNVVKKIHFVGDEAITSSALEIIRKKGAYIADAGALGIVGRYYCNVHILHPQKPFKYFEKCFLLHLPVDKFFLVKMARKASFEPAAFKRQYWVYRNSPVIIFKNIVKEILRIFIPKKKVYSNIP